VAARLGILFDYVTGMNGHHKCVAQISLVRNPSYTLMAAFLGLSRFFVVPERFVAEEFLLKGFVVLYHNSAHNGLMQNNW
jgi:hypothetical protein